MKEDLEYKGVYLTIVYTHYEEDGDGWNTPREPEHVEIDEVIVGDTNIYSLFSEEDLDELECKIMERIKDRF